MKPATILNVATWIVFFAVVVLILVLYDRRFRRQAAKAGGQIAMVETRPTKYIAVGVVLGGLVLPIYFATVKRSFEGFVIGVGWLIVAIIATASVRVAALQVVMPSPWADIRHPRDGATITGERTLYLSADIGDLKDGRVADTQILWTSDKDGDIAVGHYPIIMRLSPGAHTVTLSVTDSDGHTTTDTVRFTYKP